MKALPSPSRTVLWIARLFVIYGLLHELALLWHYLEVSDDALLPMSPSTGSAWAYRIVCLKITLTNSAMLVALIIGLFWLRSTFARVILGLTAGILFLIKGHEFWMGFTLWLFYPLITQHREIYYCKPRRLD